MKGRVSRPKDSRLFHTRGSSGFSRHVQHVRPNRGPNKRSGKFLYVEKMGDSRVNGERWAVMAEKCRQFFFSLFPRKNRVCRPSWRAPTFFLNRASLRVNPPDSWPGSSEVCVCVWMLMMAAMKLPHGVAVVAILDQLQHLWDPCIFCRRSNSLEFTVWSFTRSICWLRTV